MIGELQNKHIVFVKNAKLLLLTFKFMKMKNLF